MRPLVQLSDRLVQGVAIDTPGRVLALVFVALVGSMLVDEARAIRRWRQGGGYVHPLPDEQPPVLDRVIVAAGRGIMRLAT